MQQILFQKKSSEKLDVTRGVADWVNGKVKDQRKDFLHQKK
jgi:hypothetical protein